MRLGAAALAMALLLGGCAADGTYVSSGLADAGRLWTAVAVWGADGALALEDQGVIERAALEALGAGTPFEPVRLPDGSREALAREAALWVDGPPPALLVELARGRGVDALAVVTVRALDPYPPARVDLAIEVHSTETGALLFSNVASACGEAGAHVDGSGDPLWALRDPHRRRPARLLSRDQLARACCDALVAPAGGW